jgi:hypothetical protein
MQIGNIKKIDFNLHQSKFNFNQLPTLIYKI